MISITLQLDWKPNAQFAGILWAHHHGWYARAGIDLTIVPWWPGFNQMDALESDANVIVSTEDNLHLFARAQGKPVKAIGTMVQFSGIGWMTLNSANIRSIADLKGKRIGTHPDGLTAIKVAPKDVENAVVNVLRFHEMRATLVFCATREAVKRMHARLVERGFAAVALSGELTQNERTQALLALRDGRARVLVATDVAARGLDLPDLALVIHADLPNDKETLLHRSGRTGRAGKKGLCTLVVPYNKRRKADILLNGARLRVTWGVAPTSDEIRTRDQERFLGDAIFTETPDDLDLALAKTLQAARTADEIAFALVRMHRARLPEPEDLAEDTGPPRREDRFRPTGGPFDTRESNRPDRGSEGSGTSRPFERAPSRFAEAADSPTQPRRPRREREDVRPMVWFRLNIGRERNADPRWLLPLICKAGGITKSEIGAIKIFDKDTRFQILADCADQFADTARTNKQKEGNITRVGSYAPGDDATVADAINAIAAPGPTPVPALAGTAAASAVDAAHAAAAAPAPLSPAASPEMTAGAEPTASDPLSSFEPRPRKPKSFEKKPISKPYDSSTRDQNSRDARPHAAKRGDGKPFERKPYERKPYKGKPVGGEPPAAPTAATVAIDAKPLEARPRDTRSGDASRDARRDAPKPHFAGSRSNAGPSSGTRAYEGERGRSFDRAKPSYTGSAQSGPGGGGTTVDATRPKPPWRDRTKPKSGTFKRPEPPKEPVPQATRADNRERPRTASKYAHKKKQRQGPAAAE